MATNQAKQFPKTIYTKLDKEDNYQCQGTKCSCKYIGKNYRTEYDDLQYMSPQTMVQTYSKPKEEFEYRSSWKYIGV